MTTRFLSGVGAAVAVLALAVLWFVKGEKVMAGDAQGKTAYDFTFQSIDGTPLPFRAFAGKAVLVVNTASQCGFTPQYAALEELWKKYQGRGFVLLGVPSNDFGGQEPGTSAEIKTFCETNFSVDFPLTEKVHVKGPDAHPFYKWASAQVGLAGQPRWNFHKFLIDPQGHLADWFATPTSPTADKVLKAVEKVLPKAN